jgi:hypothetical protein
MIKNYLDYTISLNYKEKPPTMEEFLRSPQYLGNLTGEGKVVYPVWKDSLDVVAKEDSKFLYVYTGAIGTGKTRAAVYGALYTLCRILCLKDPWAHFGLTSGGQMSIVFFNLTKSESESRSYALFQSHLLASPWFRAHGNVVGSELHPRVEFSLIKYTFASPFVQGFGSQGEDVIIALMDEVDSPAATNIQRQKVLQAYENARRRLETRFVIHGETIGRFFLVASKQDRLAFLNAFIAKYKNSKSVVIVDIPIWDAKPSSHYCGKKFKVSIGDVHNPPRVLDTEEDLKKALLDGFQIIEVPVEYSEPFVKDIIGALRDIAGISTSSIRRTKLFPSESALVKCYTSDPNPVKLMTIETGLNDEVNLLDFLDLSVIKIPRNVPRFLHVDFAFSGDGDSLGLAMSCISGWARRTAEESDGSFRVDKVAVAYTDFAMRIRGHPGDRIPLHKVRKLILDLKVVHGFNINEVSYDLSIATESDKQILERAGLVCSDLSMDKSPNRYRDFRNRVFEGLWSTPLNPYLHFELKNLEDDPDKNKIDHPDEVAELEFLEDGNTREIVMRGSKDVADAVAGSVSLAIERCMVPPDIEVLTELMRKSLPKDEDEISRMLSSVAGIDLLKKPVESSLQLQSEHLKRYEAMLKRMRGIHQG